MFFVKRLLTTKNMSQPKTALVLGVFHNKDDSNIILSDNAKTFDAHVNGKLKKLVTSFGPNKFKSSKIFYDLHQDFPVVSVVDVGPQDAGYNEKEDLDERLENIRQAIAVGAKSVQSEIDVEEISIDDCGAPEAAAEGANLALWVFDELKSKRLKRKQIKISPYQPFMELGFTRGTKLAAAQNMCRRLAEMPANKMTPTIFAQHAVDTFASNPKVKVFVRDQDWAESKGMGSFISVSKGSAEPLKFLELHYNNKPDVKPFVLVGKGICFDSGGISLKPSSNMDKMRYDMGGAANVVSTIYALSELDMKVNVIGLTPLCENLPSGTANKPGDVVTAMNGKTIQIDNTDAEGRLILADGLCYAHEFEPQAILDIATLTGAMAVALGQAATGVFTESKELWKGLQKAGVATGDRVWRMPIYNYFTAHVTDSKLADCLNTSKSAGLAGSCTAAAFLKEFVECPKWVHLDIAGVMEAKDENKPSYLNAGMSGRPLRTLVYFLNKYFDNK